MAKSISIIRREDNSRFLSLLCYDKGCSIESMSDFELFAFVCDNLSFIQKSRFFSELLGTLFEELGCELTLSALREREVQKAVWRRLNHDEYANIDFAKNIIDFTEKLYLEKPSKNEVFDLNSIFSHKTSLPESIEALVDALCKCDELSIDMEGFVYKRPDEFHAAAVYERILRGEYVGDEARSLLLAWVLCRRLMRKNAKLDIVLSKDIGEARQLIGLLDNRKIYVPIALCFRAAADIEEDIAELCLNAPKKNISSEIIVSEEAYAVVLNSVTALRRELPDTRVGFCYSRGTEQGYRLYLDAFN